MPTKAKRTHTGPDAPPISIEFPFAIVPEALLYDPSIDPLAKIVYAVLARHGTSADRCFPSHARIAGFLGVSARSVQRPLQALEVAGWVERVVRSGTSTSYVVHTTPRSTARGDGDPALVGADPPASTSADPPAFHSAPNESKVNESNMNEMLDAEASSDPPVSLAARQAADWLADRIERHSGTRPKVTARWTRDLDLLIRRGPLHAEHPDPVPLDRVLRGIDFVFDRLAEPEGRRGFCWADQIRSGTALRDHWLQILDAGRRMVQNPSAQRGSRVLAALAEIDAEDAAFEARRQAIPALAVAR